MLEGRFTIPMCAITASRVRINDRSVNQDCL